MIQLRLTRFFSSSEGREYLIKDLLQVYIISIEKGEIKLYVPKAAAIN